MIAIKAENLSKAYQLGEIGTGTLSRDIERWYARISGKEDPFLRIGETNDRSTKGSCDIVWSLKDINFEIEQGDAVGIIGRNGAGKSTLLKVLSRVTAPTTGRITGKGRIASLLEVGTGFHPELTGRENIYLNGAILGMRKKEITRKFDEIVDFAGVERYIDTPVKRYSSGMYVRLAFAVAAHLESEILIVDEVLAVGDAEFQKKCLGKMGEVSKTRGKTILFVSHNMAAITALCKTGMLLDRGSISTYGVVNDIVRKYNTQQDNTLANTIKTISSQINTINIKINGTSNLKQAIDVNYFSIEVNGISTISQKFDIELKLKDSNGFAFAFYSDYLLTGNLINVSEGYFSVQKQVKLPEQLNRNTLFMDVCISIPGLEILALGENMFELEITGNPLHHHKIYDYTNGSGYLFLTNKE